MKDVELDNHELNIYLDREVKNFRKSMLGIVPEDVERELTGWL